MLTCTAACEKSFDIQCNRGYVYLDRINAFSCTACAKGKYIETVSHQIDQCSACPAGFFQGNTGQHECTQCPEHSYQDQEGQGACIACAQATNCIACPNGWFNPRDDAPCHLCPEDFYAKDLETCSVQNTIKNTTKKSLTEEDDMPWGWIAAIPSILLLCVIIYCVYRFSASSPRKERRPTYIEINPRV